MAAIDPVDMAEHVDRVRRRQITCRAGVVTREIPGGWMSVQPGADAGEVPSASGDRVFWLTLERGLTSAHVDAALAVARELGRRRVYFWLAPWAWDERVEAMLGGAGIKPWPYVEYIALGRAAGDCTPARPSEFAVRVVKMDEAAGVLDAAAAWYGQSGVETALRMMERGIAEIHGAYEGTRPVGLGVMTIEGNWAYLGAAGTDPERRGRGAQTALICARVRRAAERGAQWCASETNTVVANSLRNLGRCGFGEVLRWRVYWWEDGMGR